MPLAKPSMRSAIAEAEKMLSILGGTASRMSTSSVVLHSRGPASAASKGAPSPRLEASVRHNPGRLIAISPHGDNG
jgi:hypothetical protein